MRIYVHVMHIFCTSKVILVSKYDVSLLYGIMVWNALKRKHLAMENVFLHIVYSPTLYARLFEFCRNESLEMVNFITDPHIKKYMDGWRRKCSYFWSKFKTYSKNINFFLNFIEFNIESLSHSSTITNLICERYKKEGKTFFLG